VKYLSLLILLATSALLSFSLFKPEYLHFCFSRISYYCILTLFLSWIFVIIQYFREKHIDLRSCWREYGLGFIISLILTCLIFISVKPYFRVLADETNLVSVSKSMVFEKSVDDVSMGAWYFFNFHPISRQEPTRQFLLPFFASVVHALTGYRPENMFVVNFLLLFILFCGIFVYFKKYFNFYFALAAILCAAAQPLITQSASSAGQDLIFVVFAFICFLCLKIFLDKPDSFSFQLLWVNLLMFFNTRYEAPFYVVIILGMLVLFKQLKASYFKSILFYVTPFIVLPFFWQRICLRLDHANSQCFAVGNLLAHTRYFIRTLIDVNYYFPFAAIINIAGVIAALYFGVQMIKNKWPGEQQGKRLAWIALVCFICYWCLIGSFSLGDPVCPWTSRMFSLAALVLSLLAVAFIARLSIFKDKGIQVSIVSAVLFIIYNPFSIENRYSNTQYLTREYRHEMEFLDKQGTKNVMVVSEWPGMFTVYNYGAVNYDFARGHQQELLGNLARHLYQHIYVFQMIDFKTGLPLKDDSLPENYSLQTVFELQNTTDNFIRISDVRLPADTKMQLSQ